MNSRLPLVFRAFLARRRKHEVKLAGFDRRAFDQRPVFFPHGLRTLPKSPGTRQDSLRPFGNFLDMAHFNLDIERPENDCADSISCARHSICSLFVPIGMKSQALREANGISIGNAGSCAGFMPRQPLKPWI
jgi:hypothetical protein